MQVFQSILSAPSGIPRHHQALVPSLRKPWRLSAARRVFLPLPGQLYPPLFYPAPEESVSVAIAPRWLSESGGDLSC